MLTPNTTYKMNGVTINEKIIPDGTRWKSDAKAKAAGFGGAGCFARRAQTAGRGRDFNFVFNLGVFGLRGRRLCGVFELYVLNAAGVADVVDIVNAVDVHRSLL